MKLTVGVPSLRETVAGLELQLRSVKKPWNTIHGAEMLCQALEELLAPSKKKRCCTSVVALVLKGYNIQRFVQFPASVCLLVGLCLLEYCRGEIRVMSICRLVLFTLFLLYNNNNNNNNKYYYYNYNHCCCCCYYYYYDTQQYSCFRHCAISQKVMGSIPDGVHKIFHSLNPSDCFVGPGVLTQCQ